MIRLPGRPDHAELQWAAARFDWCDVQKSLRERQLVVEPVDSGFPLSMLPALPRSVLVSAAGGAGSFDEQPTIAADAPRNMNRHSRFRIEFS